jgi:hypothetical protein
MNTVKGMQSAPEQSPVAQKPKLRDPRLDVFRGLGMFIILIAHIPENNLASWIPARFGYSDAADLFVFCSGMASAFAFASLFEKRGWLLGAARIVHRTWQVYWAHIGSFVVIVSIAATMDQLRGGDFYVTERLNLAGFFDAGASNLARLATLRLVPDYFDILPMYLVLLAMIPLVMGLRALNRGAPFAFVLGLWLAAFFLGRQLYRTSGADPGLVLQSAELAACVLYGLCICARLDCGAAGERMADGALRGLRHRLRTDLLRRRTFVPQRLCGLAMACEPQRFSASAGGQDKLWPTALCTFSRHRLSSLCARWPARIAPACADL